MPESAKSPVRESETPIFNVPAAFAVGPKDVTSEADRSATEITPVNTARRFIDVLDVANLLLRNSIVTPVSDKQVRPRLPQKGLCNRLQ